MSQDTLAASVARSLAFRLAQYSPEAKDPRRNPLLRILASVTGLSKDPKEQENWLKEDRSSALATEASEEVIRVIGPKTEKPITVVNAWLRVPNALTIYIPEDESLSIVVDWGLVTFCSKMLIIATVLSNFQKEKSSQITALCLCTKFGLQEWYRQPETVSNLAFFAQMTNAMAQLPKGEMVLVDNILGGIFQFIVAHELGHIALKHFETGAPCKLMLLPEREPDSVSGFDAELEFAADKWGFDQLFGLSPMRDERAIQAFTPRLLFSIQNVLWTAGLHGSRVVAELDRTHPPPMERRKRIAAASTNQHDPRLEALEALFLQLADAVPSDDETCRDLRSIASELKAINDAERPPFKHLDGRIEK